MKPHRPVPLHSVRRDDSSSSENSEETERSHIEIVREEESLDLHRDNSPNRRVVERDQVGQPRSCCLISNRERQRQELLHVFLRSLEDADCSMMALVGYLVLPANSLGTHLTIIEIQCAAMPGTVDLKVFSVRTRKIRMTRTLRRAFRTPRWILQCLHVAQF